MEDQIHIGTNFNIEPVNVMDEANKQLEDLMVRVVLGEGIYEHEYNHVKQLISQHQGSPNYFKGVVVDGVMTQVPMIAKTLDTWLEEEYR